MGRSWGKVGAGAASTLARKVRAGASRLRPLSDRRRFGRIKGGRLGCNLGSVLDLSSGGMRIQARRSLRKGEVSVELWSRTQRATIRAKIVWCRRVAFRRYEVGLEFQEVSEETSRALTSFATYLRHG